MSIHDDPTQAMPPVQPPRKRRPVWRRWYVISPAALAAGIIMISALGGHSASAAPAAHPSASAPAAAPKSATYADQAADKALCGTYNTDIKTGDTASIEAALQQAGGSVSPGLAKDMQVVVTGGSVSQDVKNQVNVAMDCGLADAGTAPPAQGFGATASAQPSAATTDAAAPATDPAPAAPVFHPQTLLTLSGNGTEDTASFTVPAGGSGNWKIIWTYNEGSFGQSVNFGVTSEDFQANVSKLGPGGSGTEYVYGDPGTHHLSVISEGNWTVQVVTAS